MSLRPRISTRTAIAVVAAAGAITLLAGCSAGGSTTASSASSTPRPSTHAYGGARRGLGTSGTIAAITGTTLQVQSQSTQTAVSYTSATKIEQQTSGTLADVTVGSCIVASSFGGAAGGASGSSSSSGSTAVTSVNISQPTNGTCTAGFGRGGGARPGGTGANGGARPSGAPTARPGGGAYVPITFGKVTAVSGSTISVSESLAGSTTSKTVTVAASTKYSSVVAAGASALVVGQCVVARGQASSSGAVSAVSLTVSAPVAGTCSSGFGGFGGGRANGSGGGAGTGGSGSAS